MSNDQEHAVYSRKKNLNLLTIGVYVNDLIVTGSYDDDITNFKEKMNKEFEMSDWGMLAYYLGLEVTLNKGEICLIQKAYAKNAS